MLLKEEGLNNGGERSLGSSEKQKNASLERSGSYAANLETERRDFVNYFSEIRFLFSPHENIKLLVLLLSKLQSLGSVFRKLVSVRA